MNLTDIKPTQTAKQFSNSIENTFGVKVDVGKLDLDKSAKLLLSVNEQIQKQRLSEDRHKLHTTKSYLAKIFIKENLEKHIAELTDNEEKKTESRLIKLQELKDITARMAALEDNITELQEGKGEEVIEEELTAAQKKLPQGLQDAIAKKQGNSEESVEEAAGKKKKCPEDAETLDLLKLAGI